MTNARILIAGADEAGAARLQEHLRGSGHTVCAAVASGAMAIDAAAELRPDLALIDLGLDGRVSGVDAAARIGAELGTPVLYLTDAADGSRMQRARQTDPCGYVLKPVDARQLRLNVESALAARARERQHERAEAALRQALDDLQRQARLVEEMFESTSDGVVVADCDGNLLRVNPSARRIVGMGPTAAPPVRWAETYGIFHADGQTPFPAEDLPLVRAMRGEPSDDVELFIRNQERPQGVHISVTARPLDGAGGLEGGLIVFRDITRLKETERRLRQVVGELRDQTRLMETVFNSMGEGVIAVDRNGDFLLTNASAAWFIDTAERSLPPERWAEEFGIYHPDGRTPAATDELALTRAMRGKPTDAAEFVIRNERHPAGISISVNGRPLREESGAVIGGVSVLRDVTRLKETQDELRRTVREARDQARLMETVFESISDGVIAVDEDGRYLIFNAGAKRIVGLHEPHAELAQRSRIYGLYSRDGTTLVPVENLPLTRAMRGESTEGVEIFVRNERRPDGVSISVSGQPLRDGSGAAIGGVVVFHDMTAIRNAERELRRTAENLRAQTRTMETVFERISDGVVVADETGAFTLFNPTAKRIVGMGMTDVGPDAWTAEYGIFYADGVTPVPTGELPLVRAAIRGQPSDDVELFVRNAGVPEGVYISVSGRPLRDESGALTGGVITLRDITEERRDKDALLQAFAQGRLEILDTILHNIGNAINSVSVGVGTIHEELLKNEPVRRLASVAAALHEHRDDWITYLRSDPQGRQALPFIIALAEDFSAAGERLRKTVARVERRVTHVVDIIRTQRSFESGGMARKDIELSQTIVDVLRLMRESLANRNIDVRVDLDDAPRVIRTHESRFHQMMVNLIKNAIEAIDDLAASPSGMSAQPRIRIRAHAQDKHLVIDVIDNGIGLPEDRLRRVFAAGYTTKKGGSGLGLHSAANYAVGSGGSIQPSSGGIGTGTTMRVTLPLDAVLASVPAGSEVARRR